MCHAVTHSDTTPITRWHNLALQDVLARAVKEELLKDRGGEKSIYGGVIKAYPGSGAGPFDIDKLSAAVAEGLARVLKGNLEPEQEHTAISMVLPCEPPDMEPLDYGMELPPTCVGTTSAGKPCQKSPSGDSLFCAWHQPKPTA